MQTYRNCCKAGKLATARSPIRIPFMSDSTRRRTTLTNILLLILLLALIPGAMGIKAYRMGKDTNWDLRNYHFYNGYAQLENRMDVDISPAQMQTYFNPILDVPLYWLYTSLPSKVVGVLYGCIQGVNISLIFVLFYMLAVFRSRITKILGGIAIAYFAYTAPGFLSELGASMNDNFVSLFTLGAILLILLSAKSLNNDQKKIGFWLLGLAGFLMGIIIGGKLTAALFAVSLGLCLPFLYPSRKIKWSALGVFIVGGAAGLLLSEGFWLLNMWQRFGNPFFPNYNNLFHSPFAGSQNFLDRRFLPVNWQEYLLWPFIMAQNGQRVSELKFSDIRFAVLYASLMIWAVVSALKWIFRRRAQETPAASTLLFDRRAGNYLIAFTGLSFVLWMLQFSIYRYIVVLELLAPFVFLLVLDRIFSFKPVIPILGLLVFIVAMKYYQPYNWGRVPWTDRYIEVDRAQIQGVRNANVIMLGSSPTSYVIPFFSPDVRFLRPEGNLLNYGSELGSEIVQILHTSGYPVYLLYDVNDSSVDLARSSQELGIDLGNLDCQVLRDNMPDDLNFCKVLVK